MKALDNAYVRLGLSSAALGAQVVWARYHAYRWWEFAVLLVIVFSFLKAVNDALEAHKRALQYELAFKRLRQAVIERGGSAKAVISITHMEEDL